MLHIKRFENLLLKYNKVEKIYSNLRIILFTVSISTLYLFSYHKFYLALTIFFLFFLIYLIIRHQKIKNNIEYIKDYLFHLNQLNDKKNNNWRTKHTDGINFSNKDLPELIDFNLIGKHSLYQKLILKCSNLAEVKLAIKISNFSNKSDKIEIEKDRELLKNLAKSTFRRNRFFALSRSVNKLNIDLAAFIKSHKNILTINKLDEVIKFLPVLFFLCLFLQLMTYAFAIYIIQFFYVQLRAQKWLSIYSESLNKEGNFLTLEKLFEYVAVSYRNLDISKNKDFKIISKSFKEYNFISSMLNLKYSGMGYIVLNSLFFWDL